MFSTGSALESALNLNWKKPKLLYKNIDKKKPQTGIESRFFYFLEVCKYLLGLKIVFVLNFVLRVTFLNLINHRVEIRLRRPDCVGIRAAG